MAPQPWRAGPVSGRRRRQARSAALAGCWHLDAGQQLRPARAAAAAVVPHAVNDVADQHLALEVAILDRLEDDVRAGETFLVATESPDMLHRVLRAVDALALLVSPVAGRA